MSADNAKTIRIEFTHFRNQLPPFEPVRDSWEHEDDPRVFWLMQMEHTKVLGRFAVQIYSTPANSVPSERAFSAPNLVHNKVRNALSSERVNKLTYTYINTRVLRTINTLTNSLNSSSLRSPYELSKAQEVEIEEAILGDEELSNNSDIKEDNGELLELNA